MTTTLPCFAFGSNLSRAHWGQWRRERSLPRLLLKANQAAWLPDHELAFNYYSQTHSAGAANVMPATGQVVPGFLFDLAPGALDALDRKEGHPHAYRRVERTVLTADGQEIRALTYEATPARRRPFTAPTATYLNRIRRGYADRGLEQEQTMLEEAALGHRPSPNVKWLFVYGTLLSGESRHHILHRYGVRDIIPARIPGMLFDLGTFPGARFHLSTPHHVEGELIAVDDLPGALTVLDQIEGFPGWEHDEALFRRTLVEVPGFGRAWTYRLGYEGEPSRLIPDGSWQHHLEPTPPSSVLS